MGPNEDIVRLSPGCVTQVLANRSREIALFVEGESECELQLNIRRADYQVDWIDTRSGEVAKNEIIEHRDRILTLIAPEFDGDIALKIRGVDH